MPVYVSNIVMHLCQQICEHVSLHDKQSRMKSGSPEL
jgi:hypothetical protein